MAVFIVAIILGVICGFITKSMNESKGYEGGFAWGFWLNVIGIIVVAVRPYHQNNGLVHKYEERTTEYYDTYNREQKMTQNERDTPYVDPNYKRYANELQINESDKKFVLFHGSEQQIFSFSVLSGFEVLVNDEKVSELPQKKSMIDYDSIVEIRIAVHLNGYPDVYIPIVSKTYAGSGKYNSAINQMDQYVAGFDIIENYNKTKPESIDGASNSSVSHSETNGTVQSVFVASQIREFKSLLDDGIITEEEFQKKKQQLLGL